MLAAHEVGPIFGMGGFQLLPFYDGVRRLGLGHHLINDERSGVFAARCLREGERSGSGSATQPSVRGPPTWSPDWWRR